MRIVWLKHRLCQEPCQSSYCACRVCAGSSLLLSSHSCLGHTHQPLCLLADQLRAHAFCRRRVHKTLWWLMCFTGLDVLDYHERVLFSLGYLAVLILVLAGACKQIHTLIEVWREVLRQRMPVVNGAG